MAAPSIPGGGELRGMPHEAGAGVAIHVAHVLSSLSIGGAERVALDLARSQCATGHRVSVISLAPPPDGPLASTFRDLGATVTTLGRGPGLDYWLPVTISRWMSRHSVHLVHTHNRTALIYGAPAGALARVAVVHTKHGANPEGGRRLTASRLAGRAVDMFVAVSPETAQVARRRREIPEARLVVIENGIDLDRFRPDESAAASVRAELGLPGDAFLVGSVGRLAVEKNQALLIRAVASLGDRRAHLLIAGDGPLRAPLEELVRSLGAGDQVHLLGARSDVPRLINALDVFVLSSVTEGLPLVIAEAMATGTSVVSTAVGGVPSVIEDGRTGILVPASDEDALRDKIALLRDQPPLRRAIGEAGRACAGERFSARRMSGDYLRVYSQALARRRRGFWPRFRDIGAPS